QRRPRCRTPRGPATAGGARTGRASGVGQTATASDGAAAPRISGAEADTATTASPSSARSRVGGRAIGAGGGPAGEGAPGRGDGDGEVMAADQADTSPTQPLAFAV